MILCHSLSVRLVSHQVLLERQVLHGFLFAMVITAQCGLGAIKGCTAASVKFRIPQTI